jgi:hypothetical protein
MVCFTVPTVAAIAHLIMRKNVIRWKGSRYHLWLNLLLAGGAIFGLVDHWWNGELFLLGENLLMDMMLGVAITVSIFIIWTVIVTLDKSKSKDIIKT